MHRILTTLAFLIVGAAFLAGCSSTPPGPPMASVKGEVLFKGKPLESGTIQFKPDKETSVPIEIKNGKYQGKTLISTPALQRVLIRSADGKIPADYNDMSGIQKEVVAGDNEFNFDLK